MKKIFFVSKALNDYNVAMSVSLYLHVDAFLSQFSKVIFRYK